MKLMCTRTNPVGLAFVRLFTQILSKCPWLRFDEDSSLFIRRALGSSSAAMALFFAGTCITLMLPLLPSTGVLMAAFLIALLVSLRWRPMLNLGFGILGLLWASFNFQSLIDMPFPSNYERVDFIANGSVVGLPINQASNITFQFQVDTVEDKNLSMLRGKMLRLSCYRCAFKIQAGEQWSLHLRVKRPHGYASWGSFDYQKYLFRQQVIAKGYVRLKGLNRRIAVSGAALSQGSIHAWRQSLYEQLQASVGKGAGINIISALSLGIKSGFSNEQRQVFQTTGVSHLMAISGLHVGLVFIGVCLIFKWLLWPVAGIFEYWPRQKLVLLPALMSAVMYSALAGFAVSTQRALLMLTVYVLCRFFARDASLAKVLLIAIVVLLLIDPFSILDMGFWLSCGAVATIALISRNAETLSLSRLQPMLWLGMLPIGVFFFGQVSLISPLVNLVAVPLFCILLIPATLLSVLMFCVGLDTIGAWCLVQLSIVYEWVYHALEITSQYEFAKIHTTSFGWWQWLASIVLLILCLWPNRSRIITISSLFASAIIVGSVFLNTSKALAKDELHVALLDVGQGLAMVIETATSVTVYDTGPRYGSGFTAAEAVLLPYLWHRGIRRIDTLVISHADNDHIGGLEKLRDEFEVSRTITSRLDKVSDATECLAGQSWQYDHTKFSVISPEPKTPKGSNNLSCVILLEHLGTKVLITGDIEKQVERFLVLKAKSLFNSKSLSGVKSMLSADILLVPHQGSKTSSTETFIDAVSPQMAMLAAGYKNHYGHPHKAVVERYQSRSIELLSTVENGSILLKINSHGWRKVTYRQRYKRFWHY